MLMPWRQDPVHRTVHPRTLLLHLLLLETATLRVHSGCLLPIGAKAHPVRRGSDCRAHAILLRGVPPTYGLRLRGGEGGDHDHASSSELPRLSETRLTSAASVSTRLVSCKRCHRVKLTFLLDSAPEQLNALLDHLRSISNQGSDAPTPPAAGQGAAAAAATAAATAAAGPKDDGSTPSSEESEECSAGVGRIGGLSPMEEIDCSSIFPREGEPSKNLAAIFEGKAAQARS